MEEINFCLDAAQEGMQSAVNQTIKEFSRVRAGKASQNMLDGLMVKYYDSLTPIGQIASVSTPDARTLIIKPWEKGVLRDIETAIINSDLGLNPQNDGELIKLFLPPPTEERRRELVKTIKKESENGKVRIRNVRKEINEDLKKLKDEGVSEDDLKRAEEQIQKFTTSYSAKIDELVVAKEKEIMTI